MEHLAVGGEPESTFLPFRGDDSRFNNFALMTELLRQTLVDQELGVGIDFVAQNVFGAFSMHGLHLMTNQGDQSWKILYSNLSANQEIRLSVNHAISACYESGAIGFASTNGRLFTGADESLRASDESYRLVLIPLIDNLVPRSILVAIVGNSKSFSPADIELFSFVQLVLSFIAYGSKPLDLANYDF